MPLSPFTDDQVAHLRHCVRIESKIESYRMLHGTIQTQGTSGTIDALTWDEITARALPYDGTWFWIYPAATNPSGTSGAHNIATAMCMAGQSDSTDVCHNMVVSGSSVAFSLRSNNAFTDSEAWFVQPESDEWFTIASANGGVLTAASSGVVSLTAWTGQDNQMWRIMDEYPPVGGCFATSPALDESQSIQSLTTTPMSYALIGSSAQKTAHVAMSSEVIEQITSPTNLTGQLMTGLAYPTSMSEDKWNRVELYDEETMRVQFEQGGRLRLTGTRNGALLPVFESGGLLSVSGVAGIYRSQSWTYNTSDPTLRLSSSDGERSLGAFPTFQAASSDPTEPTQNWYMLPQNLYDPTLPTPYDITCDLLDSSNNVTRLTQSQALPVAENETFRLRPTFVCDASRYLVTIRMRYLVGGVWSDVVDVIQPTNSNLEGCSEAPLAKWDGAPGWIPNAYAHSWPGQWAGRDGISQDITMSGLFDGHTDADACQLTLSITAMRYGAFTGLPPVPYEGRTASATYVIGRYTSVTLGSATIESDGIHIPVTTTGNEVTSIHLDSLALSSGGTPPTYTEHLQAEGFTTDAAGGVIVIPFTALKLIDSPLMSASSATLFVSAEARTSFSSLSISSAISLTSSLVSEASPSMRAHAWGGYVRPFMGSVDYSPQILYQVAEGERGRRYVAMPYVTGYGAPFITRTGSYLDDVSTQLDTAMVIGTLDGNPCFSLITRPQPTRPVAAIYRYVEDTGTQQHIEVIPMQGNLSTSLSADNDAVSARRLGGRYGLVGSTGGQAGTLKFSGTMFKGQIDSTIPSPQAPFSLRQDIQALYEIPASESVILRMPTGTEYLVRVLGVSSPRDEAESANITLTLIEVEQ